MRLIDADAAKARVLEAAVNVFPKTDIRILPILTVMINMFDCKDDFPTIEAEPVRHGHWYEGGGMLLPMHRYDEYTNPESVFNTTCSECHITINCNGVLNGYNYCPNCCAKMDGKE